MHAWCACGHVCVYACMHCALVCIANIFQTVCLLSWVHVCTLEVHACPDNHSTILMQAFSYFNQPVVTMTM